MLIQTGAQPVFFIVLLGAFLYFTYMKPVNDRMRIAMPYLAIVFLLLAVPGLSWGGGVVKKSRQNKKVYVLSIGFSPERKKTSQSDLLNIAPCPTCVKDASGMSDYFTQLARKKAPYVDSVFTFTYTADITLDTLYNVFNRIQQQITKDDIFIFYYASIAWGLQKDDAGNEEGFYAFNNKKSAAAKDDNYAFTLRLLKTLTDRISALQQMIIIDTGSGDVILPDYYRNFFNDNLSEAIFSRKNRVILCPEKMSSESIDKKTNTPKGDLFKVISNLPDTFNVLAVFDTTDLNARKMFYRHWYENQIGLMAHIRIIQETEYLKILTAVQHEQGDGKRGLSIRQKPAAVDSNILHRKKKVLIVATSDYAARSIWSPLRNPVNDGRDAALVFSKLGYEVTSLYNKPKDSILSAISAFIDNEVQNPYSQYIIYFAGHGYYDQRQKAGYIVCSDSREFKDAARPSMAELGSYIDYTVLFRNLDQLNKVILITDVCFGGTSLNSMLQAHREVDPSGETDKIKNPFKRVLASGITEVADFIRSHNGSVSRNSPFAAALFDILGKEEKSLSFEELYGRLKNNKALKPTPVESSFGTEKIPNTFTF